MLEPLALIPIAGAPEGNGMACARVLGAAGHRLLITGPTGMIEVRRAELIAEGFDVTAFQGDMSDPATVAHLFEQMGPVSVLVNMADTFVLAHGSEALTKDQRRRLLDLALTTSVLVTRAALPGMLQQRYGRVVMIGSDPKDALRVKAKKATKDPMIGLVQVLAQDVGSQGVTVNGIAPGWVATDTALAARAARADEIAACVRFLMTPNASDINGAILIGDGTSPPQERTL